MTKTAQSATVTIFKITVGMRLILNLKIEENGAEIHGLLVKFKE